MGIGRLLIIGGLALAAVAGGAVSYVRSIDFDTYRPALAAELRAATGRDVVIDGPVGLSLWPRPRFYASRVAVANAPWGTRAALARIDRVEADIAVLPLLRGAAAFSRIRLVRPDLWFETDSVGKINWILAADGAAADTFTQGAGTPPAGEGADASEQILSLLDIERVDFDGGRITYRDGATGDITVLAVRSAVIEGDGHSAPLEFAFVGDWNSMPLALRGVVGPFDAVASDDGTASVVKLRFESGGTRAAVEGTVGNPHRGPGAVLRVSAEAEDLDLLGRRLGIALPLVRNASISGTLLYRKARLDMKDLTLKAGERDLTGSVSVDLSGERPGFEGVLHTVEIDGGALAAAIVGRPGDGAELTAFQALADSGLLAAADGAITLRADRMRMGTLRFSDLDARIALMQGKVAVAPARAHSIAGKVEAGIEIDGSVVPATASAYVKVPAFSPGPLLQRAGTVKAFGGVASVAASVTTILGTSETMLQALDGDVLLAMGEGRLALEPVDPPFARNATGLGLLAGLPVAETRQDVTITCVAGRLTIEGPRARSDGFVLQSADARVKGEGDIDLETGRVDISFVPEARNGPLLVAAPVRIGGTLADPLVAVDEAAGATALSDAALYPFRRFFRGLTANPSANACLRELPPIPRKRGARGRPIAQRTGRPEAPKAVPPPVNFDNSGTGAIQAE